MLSCNHKPKLLFSIDTTNFYSSDYCGANDFTGDMILNLTGRAQVPNIYQTEFKLFLKPKPTEVVLDWPDCGLPPIVDQNFWKHLVSYSHSICVHCAAGHGRTGTALACILVANKNMTAEEAITFIRQEHCPLSVETKEQVRYIYELDLLINKREIPERINILGSSEPVPLTALEAAAQRLWNHLAPEETLPPGIEGVEISDNNEILVYTKRKTPTVIPFVWQGFKVVCQYLETDIDER